MSTPTLLLILDGWGVAPAGEGNAVSLSQTPNLDRLLSEYPKGTMACSGRAVGLPDGFMGNSEVGHMNLGAGRVIYQDMTRIDMAVEDGSLADNATLNELFEATIAGSGRLHLMGLVSDGGVHSHQNHIYALLELAREKGVPETFVHCFLDGRDTPPKSGAGYVSALRQRMEELNYGTIATVTGRYWAMDRDSRFERNQKAYEMLVNGKGVKSDDAVAAINAAYAEGETDEFVKPRVLVDDDGNPRATIGSGDGVFFFNFRADRARQISRCLFEEDFVEFDRGPKPDIAMMATMTRYESSFPLKVAFPPQSYDKVLGEVVSGLGKKQLRIAETEKYAHVTYFFNCGREEPFEGEDRVLVPSPRDVATYDLKPAMSACEVADKLLERLGDYELMVCNLANLDMVGHTGIIPAVIEAVETVDGCVGRIVDAMLERGGRVLLTADHGNAEEMIGPDGGPQTAHSTNVVPLVYIENGAQDARVKDGKLGDIAPTILSLWGEAIPDEMTGEPLVEKE